MLKTNVIKKAYQFTLQHASGVRAVEVVVAESPTAARLLCPVRPGWEIAEVTQL